MTSRRRAVRGVILHRMLRLAERMAMAVSLDRARAVGGLLGKIAWRVLRRERRRALEGIAVAFPEWTQEQRELTIRGMFLHLGQCLAEILWLPRLDADTRARLTSWEGLERLQPYLGTGSGVVIFTAHCGNWEWLANAFGVLGAPTSVLQRERDEPDLNRFITERRDLGGVRTIDRGSGSTARQMLNAIRTGALAFVLDQNIRAESVRVPFFGRPALTPIGPAKLAIRTTAVAVTILIERCADGTQLIHVNEPIPTSREDDPVELTARITREIEAQIRRVPEQWVWMHRRWRERPQWDVTETRRAGARNGTPSSAQNKADEAQESI